jgi:tRNA A37 N6-isopentenylltransferase MiaA
LIVDSLQIHGEYPVATNIEDHEDDATTPELPLTQEATDASSSSHSSSSAWSYCDRVRATLARDAAADEVPSHLLCVGGTFLYHEALLYATDMSTALWGRDNTSHALMYPDRTLVLATDAPSPSATLDVEARRRLAARLGQMLASGLPAEVQDFVRTKPLLTRYDESTKLWLLEEAARGTVGQAIGIKEFLPLVQGADRADAVVCVSTADAADATAWLLARATDAPTPWPVCSNSVLRDCLERAWLSTCQYAVKQRKWLRSRWFTEASSRLAPGSTVPTLAGHILRVDPKHPGLPDVLPTLVDAFRTGTPFVIPVDGGIYECLALPPVAPQRRPPPPSTRCTVCNLDIPASDSRAPVPHEKTRRHRYHLKRRRNAESEKRQ